MTAKTTSKSWLNREVNSDWFSFGAKEFFKGLIFYLIFSLVLLLLNYISVLYSYKFIPGEGDLDSVTPYHYWDWDNVVYRYWFYAIFGFWIGPLASVVSTFRKYKKAKNKGRHLEPRHLISNIGFSLFLYIALIILLFLIQLFTI